MINILRDKFRIFVHFKKNYGLFFSLKKTAIYLASKVANLPFENKDPRFSSVVFFLKEAEVKYVKNALNIPSSEFVFVNRKRIIKYNNECPDDYKDSALIFCFDANSIAKALKIRSCDWRSKLIVSEDVFLNLDFNIIEAYVDHVLGSVDFESGFEVDYYDNIFNILKFYYSLFGFKSSKYKFLNLYPVDSLNVEEIRSTARKKYSIRIGFDYPITTKGADTFSEILNNNSFKITSMTEDLFWLYNGYSTRSSKIVSEKILERMLRKGVYVDEVVDFQ